MDPQEALSLLNNAVSQIKLSREDHVRLQTAVNILIEAIRPKTAKEEKK